MPKKTREQKLRAQERRLKQFEETVTPVVVDEQASKQSADENQPALPSYQLPNLQPTAKLPSIKSVPTMQVTAIDQDVLSVRQDVRRIALLSVIVLIIEFSLFWLLVFQHLFGF